MKVRVRFRFNDLKFIRFRFGSGSPKKSGFYRFAVQVRFDSLIQFNLIYRSDGRMNRASASGLVDSEVRFRVRSNQ